MRWFALIFLLLSNRLYGAHALELNTLQGQWPLSSYIELLEDPSGKLTLEDVSSGQYSSRWTPNLDESPNLGFTKSAVWVRMFINDTLPEKKDFLFELAYAHHDALDFFLVDKNEVLLKKTCGRNYPFGSRDVPYRNCVFAAALEHNSYTIYLRSQTEGSMALPLTLWQPDTFMTAKMHENSILFLYYGIMVVMVIYNLFLFLSTRKINFIYYVAYIACFTIWMMAYNGVAFELLWPNTPWLGKISVGSFLAFSMFWGFSFFRHFLNSRANTPIMDKFLFIAQILSLLIVFCSFFVPYHYFIIAACITVVYGLPATFYTGVLCIAKGYRPARFFVLAFFLFIISGIVLALRLTGFFPYLAITEFSLQIGSAAEVILLSLALADQIKYEQRQAQQEIENLNENLEQKVKEQTDDIRNQKEQLAKANDELKVADKQKTSFFQNISHELRTPLTLILNTHQKVAARYPQDTELTVAHNNSKRLYRLVNQLLDFQRLESKNKEIKLAPVNLTSFINVCNDYFSTATSVKEVQVNITINGEKINGVLGREKIIINAEIDALEKIAFNFLSNALKYSPPRGTVEFGVKTHLDRVRMFVKDDGPGITPLDQEKLFKVFSQVDDSSTREYEGTGLGLAFAKELTNKMGGEIGVESEAGKGSCFWAEFPLHIKWKEILDLLIVDDEAEILDMLKSELIGHSSRIRGVRTSTQARAMISQYQIKALITDQNMPEEDGVSLLSFMSKEQPQCARLMITGHADQNVLQRAINEGSVHRVYYKPLDLQLIIPNILEIIRNSSVQDIITLNDNFQVKDWLLEKTDNHAQPEPTDAMLESVAHGGKEIILVIDDMRDMRDLIAGMLRAQKYAVATATDGVDGLLKAKTHKPNLIIVDWMMPKMAGPEFIKNLRETSELATTPVILLTARSDQESKLIGLAVGADAFLGKPFDELELLSIVTNLLKLKSGEQKISNSLEDKSILVAMITHDIANPLTVTTSAAEMLETMLSSPTIGKEQAQKFVDMVKKPSASISSIISQVKLLESVDNKQIFDFKAVSMAEALEESLQLVADKIAAKQIVIINAVDDALVLCDKSALVHSVITNMLTNAIKFSNVGGKITCRVRSGNDANVVMEICDEGCGVPPEIQKVLFSIGHRTTRRGTSGEKGTGFGLPIAKKLLSKMGGVITVESPYQLDNEASCTGTKFSITLPKFEDVESNPNPSDNGPGTSHRSQSAA